MAFAGARIIVKGVVQGVGFRYWTFKTAQSLDILGYVSNLPDGSVEAVAEGERGMIEEFIKAIKVGPTYSDVTDLSIEWYNKPRSYNGFTIE
jgi:acylphosphatase